MAVKQEALWKNGYVTGTKPLTSVTNNAVASDKMMNMSAVFLIQMEFLISTSAQQCGLLARMFKEP